MQSIFPGADGTGTRFLSVSIFLVLVLFAAPVSAQHDFSLHATAGASVQGWSAGMAHSAVKVETESLRALRLESRLAYRGLTLLSLSHGRTLDDSPHQAEMLVAADGQSGALEQTLGVLDLLALVAADVDSWGDELNFWDLLLGLRFSYTHNLHFGRTASAGDFAYVSFGGPADPVVFKDGSQLSFRTRFRDLRVMTPIWFNPLHPGAASRLGFFHSRWEKVAVVSDKVFEGKPVVHDTQRDTAGVSMSYEHNLDWPGFGFGLAVDWGLWGTGLTTPEAPDEEAEVPKYAAFRGEIRYNLGRNDGRSGMVASVGAGFEFRGWQQGDQNVDRDVLTHLFGRVGFDIIL